MSEQKKRIYTIDMLKGICILYMIIDHWRDSLSRMGQDILGAASPLPVNAGLLDYADMPIFWVRILGNPFVPAAFIFLAGASCFLWQSRRGQEASLFHYLFYRGLMLAVLNCLLFFHEPFSTGGTITLHVLWPIGIGMIFLGCLAKWPKGLLWLMAIISILGQNFFETIQFSPPILSTLWSFAFIEKPIPLPWGAFVYNLWPIVPWFGILLLGYLCGFIFLQGRQGARCWAKLCLLCLGLFLFLRSTGLYGDPSMWQWQDTAIKSFGALFTLSKYPPSVQFSLIGLSATFFFLALFEKYQIKNKILIYYGSMPLFFYVSHLICIRVAKFFIVRLPPSIVETIKTMLFSLHGVFIGSMCIALIIALLAKQYKKLLHKRALKKTAPIAQ